MVAVLGPLWTCPRTRVGACEVSVSCSVMLSAPEAQVGDERSIPFDVVGGHVVEQPTPFPDEHEQTTPTVMVLLVDLRVFGEVVDAIAEERDLDLRRPCVVGRQIEGLGGSRDGFRLRRTRHHSEVAVASADFSTNFFNKIEVR